MKKTIKNLLLVSLFVIILFPSCSKDGYQELKGTWINEILYDDDDDEILVIYSKYEFEKDKLIFSRIYELDGEIIKKATCEGTWEYVDGDYIKNNDIIGMIEIKYDLSTIKGYATIGNENEFLEDFRHSCMLDNDNLEYAKNKGDIFGFRVVSFNENEIEIQGKDKSIFYFIREDEYRKGPTDNLSFQRLKEKRERMMSETYLDEISDEEGDL